MRRFRSDEFVPYLMRRVSERLSKSLAEALKPFDQTPNAWRVLVALVSRDRASISELAEFTIIDQSTLSRTVDRMEQQRLVKRTPSDADGRTVVVSLTDAGQRAFDQMLPIASAQYEWAIRGIPARNVDVMRTTLQQMLNNIRFSPIK
jgi:DNA-binding MarR family transcriptional regulator